MRDSIRLLMPKAQKSYLQQSGMLKKNLQSKCDSPGPKTTKAGRISLFALNPEATPLTEFDPCKPNEIKWATSKVSSNQEGKTQASAGVAASPVKGNAAVKDSDSDICSP